ncbi:RsmE family RNA methyltransferase [Marinicrinis sediminis]|uniref:Ribosomal RNA small subunit methyltransferase E n=1 Tax=Marinicrinis sediminis TaxID=1652465 RepID=A0ABW5RBV0_9BACL
MQRYMIAPEQWVADTVTLTGDDAHHLMNVMRAAVDEKIWVSDGEQREGLVIITDIQKGKVTGRVEEERALEGEPQIEVWIAQSLPKGDKLETVIQKGTELGATRFIPFQSARTIVQYDAKKEIKRLERWRKIIKEAAEQAHRSCIPVMERPLSWKEMLEAVQPADAIYFCYERPDGAGLRTMLSELRAKWSNSGSATERLKVAVIVGPEGGFTEAEAEEAKRHRASWITLGKRILRTETAAMAALACILYEFDEMGGPE